MICPGFVNAHAHLEYATYAGFGDGLPFDRWLIVHMERKGRLEDGDAVAIARLGAAESLRSGITTVADASFTGASAPACAELGLRAIVHLEVFGRSADAIAEQFEPKRERIADSLSDRVRLGISPHAPYTVTPELYAAALELGLPVQTHLAESAAEDEWLRFGTGSWTAHAHLLVDPPGASGIRVLARHGLLDRRMVAAHCVLVDDEEIALLAEHDVAVAHCPRSNALLGCGVAPVAALTRRRRAGRARNRQPRLDAVLRHVRGDARGSAPRARVRAPTPVRSRRKMPWNSLPFELQARSISTTRSGSLAPGKRADLTVVSLAGTAYLPWEDPAAAVVFGGTPERVELTLVDGEDRYRKGGETWQRLRRDARSERRRLLSDLPQAQKT